MKRLHSIEAMRAAARRRLPRVVFDYLDGGAGREYLLKLNASTFDSVRLWPRVLQGVVQRSQSMELFGRRYAAPFGIAPIGMANLVGPGVDLALARAAAGADIVYVLSAAGTTSIESIAAANPNAWFQLYVGRDADIVDDLIARARSAELPVLVVTADVPAPGRRLRDLHNGLSLPLRLTPRMALDMLTHPAWLLRTALGGAPRFANYARYTNAAAKAGTLTQLMAQQSSARLDWELLENIRGRWPRRLVLKGVLRPEDALRAARLGVDAVLVSNHGGRQFDAAPATLDALRVIQDAVGSSVKLILDGGVRSGDDVARALAFGADLVLLGRPFMYAVAALGVERGARELIELLTTELDLVLAQLGCGNVDQLFAQHYTLPAGR